MKNMLGEEREPQKLSVDKDGWIYRGKDIFGLMKVNGWTGKSASIDFEVGEPIIQLFPSNSEISLKEMQFLIAEWEKIKTTAIAATLNPKPS